MRISERLGGGSACFSFEFFPPKTDEGVANLFEALRELAPLEPAFVSVPYGAGGSSRARTLEMVPRSRSETGIEPVAHLACIGHTRGEIGDILDRLREAAIDNVLCLRGDPPRDQPFNHGVIDGFRFASDLVGFVRRGPWGFTVGAACY